MQALRDSKNEELEDSKAKSEKLTRDLESSRAEETKLKMAMAAKKLLYIQTQVAHADLQRQFEHTQASNDQFNAQAQGLMADCYLCIKPAASTNFEFSA